MSHRELKEKLYTQFARVGKALASPQRLELVDLLALRLRGFCSLAIRSLPAMLADPT